eukprot:PhM_4_TR2436/c2_g1_i1/m.78616
MVGVARGQVVTTIVRTKVAYSAGVFVPVTSNFTVERVTSVNPAVIVHVGAVQSAGEISTVKDATSSEIPDNRSGTITLEKICSAVPDAAFASCAVVWTRHVPVEPCDPCFPLQGVERTFNLVAPHPALPVRLA